ncbi:MAG: glycosyltransferase family 9 protein [Candidatus Thorarchaeota archaeon]|jgi:ADP-heptose:LPS heptosyltransferase
MKTVLFVLGGGIGNIVQATPAIKAVSERGYTVDLLLHCNSSKDVVEIFSIPEVRSVFLDKTDNSKYDYQLRGPFTPGKIHNANRNINTRVKYAQHIPESEVYYDLAKQIGITKPMGDVSVNVGTTGPDPEKPGETVAIYPGSKHNWAMKRWDKYDELAKHFDSVLLVGSKKDIYSQGDPAWIKKNWSWPKHVKVQIGSLRETAYAISKCKMFIGNDGGLAHVSAATGIPTFVIFGPSSVIKNKPYSKKAYAIAIDIPCRPCQFSKGLDGNQIFGGDKASCPHDMKCMRDLEVNKVLSEIKKHII